MFFGIINLVLLIYLVVKINDKRDVISSSEERIADRFCMLENQLVAIKKLLTELKAGQVASSEPVEREEVGGHAGPVADEVAAVEVPVKSLQELVNGVSAVDTEKESMEDELPCACAFTNDVVTENPVEPEITDGWQQKELVSPVSVLNDQPGMFDKIRSMGWEQWLGTRGILLAGIITTIIGGLFFVKYAAEHGMLGPLGRVILISVCGFAAVGIGEFTRRRNFDLVARGLTALGFALLYTAVFSSYKFYGLIGSKPAFGLSILVTIAAMAYSMRLNDRLPAFVALLGGYLSPVLLGSDSHNYNALCGYLLILSSGALLCAFYKKWRVVNWLAFLGTTANLGGWILSCALDGRDTDMVAQTSWTAIFFLLFMTLPVLHEIRFSVFSKRGDIALIISNCMITMVYFANIFDKGLDNPRLAGSYLGMALAHLALMFVLYRRSRQDSPLRVSLLAISLFLITVALPVYFHGHALAVSLSAECVLLLVVAYRYRSKISEFFSGLAFILVNCMLIGYLADRNEVEANYVMFSVAAIGILVGQYLYRWNKYDVMFNRTLMTNIYYGSGMTLLLALSLVKWNGYCQSLASTYISDLFVTGAAPLLIAYSFLCGIRPMRPEQRQWSVWGLGCAVATVVFVLMREEHLYAGKFMIFANVPFVVFTVVFMLILLMAYLADRQLRGTDLVAIGAGFGFVGILFFWLLITLQIRSFWQWHGDLNEEYTGKFMATMYISVFWAVYAAILIIIGFWRRMAKLRYFALGLFVLTIGKVFMYDMSNLENIYRIAGFVVLGILMLAVSFMYQYARNKSQKIIQTQQIDKDIEM